MSLSRCQTVAGHASSGVSSKQKDPVEGISCVSHSALTLGLAAAGGVALGAVLGGAKGRVAAAQGDDLSHELSLEEQRTVNLFERCSASVVHINTYVGQETLPRGFVFPRREIPHGTGSGFAWDNEHIVTNYHVIKGAEKAVVVLSDHSSAEATCVGAAPDCDVAVLKLQVRKDLVPLERGGSSHLHVGQKVFAIGNPFGLDQTLTSGIVSGLGREMEGVNGRVIRGLIQTDAAINPGNSGGPLLNARGRLIGVNTMIASPSGAFAGVGFALPVDTVERVVQQLLSRTKRAYLGVHLAPEHIAEQVSRRVRSIEGVLVLSIEAGSPAEDAGLRPFNQLRNGSIQIGDEILAVDRKKVTSPNDLVDAVEAHKIGDRVELHIRRADPQSSKLEVVTAVVTLSQRPDQELVQQQAKM